VDSIGLRSARSQTGRDMWTASAYGAQDHKQEGTCGQHRPTECTITNKKGRVDSIGLQSAQSQTGRDVWTASAYRVHDHKQEGTCGQHRPTECTITNPEHLSPLTFLFTFCGKPLFGRLYKFQMPSLWYIPRASVTRVLDLGRLVYERV
jgi:hypothetical protein